MPPNGLPTGWRNAGGKVPQQIWGQLRSFLLLPVSAATTTVAATAESATSVHRRR
jgi:hypothetical protein